MIFLPLLLLLFVYFDLKRLREQGSEVAPLLIVALLLVSYWLAGYCFILFVGFTALSWLMFIPVLWTVFYFAFRSYKIRELKAKSGTALLGTPRWMQILFWVWAIFLGFMIFAFFASWVSSI